MRNALLIMYFIYRFIIIMIKVFEMWIFFLIIRWVFFLSLSAAAQYQHINHSSNPWHFGSYAVAGGGEYAVHEFHLRRIRSREHNIREFSTYGLLRISRTYLRNIVIPATHAVVRFGAFLETLRTRLVCNSCPFHRVMKFLFGKTVL